MVVVLRVQYLSDRSSFIVSRRLSPSRPHYSALLTACKTSCACFPLCLRASGRVSLTLRSSSSSRGSCPVSEAARSLPFHPWHLEAVHSLSCCSTSFRFVVLVFCCPIFGQSSGVLCRPYYVCPLRGLLPEFHVADCAFGLVVFYSSSDCVLLQLHEPFLVSPLPRSLDFIPSLPLTSACGRPVLLAFG